MTFESAGRYRRRPDTVHAVRLTPEGGVPAADWIRAALERKVLTHGPGGWFANTGVSLQAAYGGDWLVLHDATQAVEVLSDGAFRARYEEAAGDK